MKAADAGFGRCLSGGLVDKSPRMSLSNFPVAWHRTGASAVPHVADSVCPDMNETVLVDSTADCDCMTRPNSFINSAWPLMRMRNRYFALTVTVV